VSGDASAAGTLRVESTSPDDTRALGRRVGALAGEGTFIGLVGDLGSGKTVFVQGLARGLDSDDPVSSPTFVIVNEYEGRLPILHVDLYRLPDAAAVESLGYRELFWSDAVTVVEWAERAGDLRPSDRLDIVVSIGPGEARTLKLKATGPEARSLLASLSSEPTGG